MIIKEHEKEKIRGAESVSNIMIAILQAENQVDQDKEHFWVMGLTTSNTIKYIELVSLGSLNRAIAEPREVFRMAIMQGVNSIITIHNHPSGDTKESKEDIITTKQLQEVGEILGIKLLDHIIIGRDTSDNYNSLQAEGYLIRR